MFLGASRFEIAVFVIGLVATALVTRLDVGDYCFADPSCEPTTSDPISWMLLSMLAWVALWTLWMYWRRRHRKP